MKRTHTVDVALWLLRQGKSLTNVAPIISVHYRTLQSWVAGSFAANTWFRSTWQGVEAIASPDQSGFFAGGNWSLQDHPLGMNTQSGRLVWDWIDRIRQEQLLPVLRRWFLDAIVWDNASSHKGKQVAALDHKLVFLPSYSPELNPAERIFREFRREIEGQPYPSLYAKQQYVEHLLRQLASDRQRVKRLTNWWWIRDALDRLPVA